MPLGEGPPDPTWAQAHAAAARVQARAVGSAGARASSAAPAAVAWRKRAYLLPRCMDGVFKDVSGHGSKSTNKSKLFWHHSYTDQYSDSMQIGSYC